MRFDWTEGRVRRMRELRDEGLSAAQIAVELGGISRNAVIGKLSRLGLHTKPPSGRSKASYPLAGPPVRAIQRRAPHQRASFLDISFVDLTLDQCRYTSNDDAPFLFCGQPVVFGTSWCQDCAEIVFGMPLSEAERERRRAWGRQIGRRNVASIANDVVAA